MNSVDKVIIILFVIVSILVVITSGYIYYTYNNLCNNSQEYKGVEFIQSTNAYHLCGKNFGIINTSDSPIIITKRTINDSEASSVELKDTTSVESTTLEINQSLPIEASDNIVYQVSNPLGSNMDHSIEMKKF